MDGFLIKGGKKRLFWTLNADGSVLGYKKPTDKAQGKKPAETMSLHDCFVDIPGGPAALQNAFSIVPMHLGKTAEIFVVDSDRPEEDRVEWAGHLLRVIERVNSGNWAKSVRKVQLQVWPETVFVKDTKEEYIVFTFRVKSSGGEWLFKQRFSGLAKWHHNVVEPAHVKSAPKFPSKHALSKQNEKFVEIRRLDLCRYFLQLLGLPGFLQSSELAILLDKKKNAALADKDANMVAVVNEPSAEDSSGAFDASKFDAPDEWIALNRAKVNGPGSTSRKGTSMHERLRNQNDSAWHLDDEQLDLAAYEMLFLTVGTSSCLLSPKERETLDFVRAKLGISRKKMADITAQMLNREADTTVDEGEMRTSLSDQFQGEGFLDIMKGQKAQRRYFRVHGLEIKYYEKQKNSARESGIIDLEEASSCRPAGSDLTSFLIECPGRTFQLRAASDEECRDWIQKVHQAMSTKRGADAFQDNDEVNEELRKLEHRFRLLQNRRCSDFSSPRSFLSWRKRQIVTFASGMTHSIDMYKAFYPNFEASLEGTQRKLLNQWDKLLKNPTEKGDEFWTEKDEDDYDSRMQRIEVLVEDAYAVARRASKDDSYMEWHSFHVSTVLYERLLVRACFEDPEFGGDLEMNASMGYSLLKEMSSHLGFVDGMHNICFSLALVKLYKLTKNSAHLEQLEMIVGSFMERPDPLQFQCVQIQLQLLETFCEELLSDYRKVEESSHLSHVVQCYMALYASRAATGSHMRDPTERLSSFIKSSVAAHYGRVKNRVMEDSSMQTEEKEMEPHTPMERLQKLVDVLQEEMETELAEYAAYIGVHHSTAAAVAAQTVADLLNADLKVYFADVQKTDAGVMAAWASLRVLEAKIIEAMESCGAAGSDAKVLKVDEAMETIAADWVEEKTQLFENRMRRAVDDETWKPMSESQQMSASTLDIVSMLMQVSRGYFQNELPVSEQVMMQLASKFGFILQQYVRMVEQQCGEMPNIDGRRVRVRLESDTVGDAKVGSMLGRAQAAAKLAQERAQQTAASVKHALEEGDETDGNGAVQQNGVAQLDGPDIPSLCVRLSSVHFVLESCDQLLEQIITGASMAAHSFECTVNTICLCRRDAPKILWCSPR
jgi:hypothetical protein